jgi:hypothetical protein
MTWVLWDKAVKFCWFCKATGFKVSDEGVQACKQLKPITISNKGFDIMANPLAKLFLINLSLV